MDINSKINITEALTQSELKEIVTLSRKHPYWHIPLAILARHFRIKGSEKIEVASAMAAMRVPSQSELYTYVYSENGLKEVLSQEIAHPEAKKIEKKTPEVKSPEKKAPKKETIEVKTPEVKTPEVKSPEKKAPKKETIEVKTPEVKATKVKSPEKKAPKKETPEVKKLEVKAPDKKPKESKIPQEEKDHLETYEEISPFTTELKSEHLPEAKSVEKIDVVGLPAKETVEKEHTDSPPVEIETTLNQVPEEKEVNDSVERTLEEIESLMNRKDSFNIIPEGKPEENKVHSDSNSAMDVFDSSYDIADHFSLPEDSIVGEGEDFYFWLKQPLIEPSESRSTEEKKSQAKPVKKKKATSTQNKTSQTPKAPSSEKPSKADILDAFIRKNPSISKINKEDTPSPVDYSNKAGEMPIELATETLARIYEEQGNLKAAKKIYTTLMLKFPTKKPYFADRIKKLKKS